MVMILMLVYFDCGLCQSSFWQRLRLRAIWLAIELRHAQARRFVVGVDRTVAARNTCCVNPDSICYLDNNATTRIAPEVVESMLPVLRECWGNPSSVYTFGREAARRVETAREQVARLINADPREIVFTSGGTESNNSALQSGLFARPGKRHVVTTAVEHAANLKFCLALEQEGCVITLLPVEPDGSLRVDRLEAALRPETAIVSVMWANNETGVLFPIEAVAALCRSRGVLFHTDAVQVPGRLPIDVKQLGVDFLSLSAHKLHGPKGTGLLYVKRKTRYRPYVVGGGQEQGRRGGTENVAGIVGFGRAAELAQRHLLEENGRIRELRDRLEQGILDRIPGVTRHGAGEPRLVNTSNLSFDGVEAEGILLLLDQLGICVSSGSACTSGSLDPSHVLLAMGCSVARARGSVRFSLGVDNTEADVNYVLEQLPGVIAKLRANPQKAAQA
jgi:cysteine desulfurase